MALQIRRGTEAQRAVLTGVAGELLYTTDTKKLYVGDGVTAGGTEVAIDLTAPGAIGSVTPSTGAFTTIGATAPGTGDFTTIGATAPGTGDFTNLDSTVLTASTSLDIGSTIAVTGVLDEDTMSSDSAVKLATQQSIKAFGGFMTFSLIESGDVTTASTTFVTTGLAITRTLKANKQHLVTFTFVSANNVSASNSDFDIFDGTNYASSGTATPETNGIMAVNQPAAGNDIPVTVQGVFTGLDAGSKTFTLYHKVEHVAHTSKVKANPAGPKVVATIIELN